MEKFSISSENIKENTFKSFYNLRKDGDFFDVTLVSDDGIPVHAHKVLLSASSKFFKESLKKTNHPNPMIYMSGFSEKVLVAIVDYIYEAEVQLYQEEIQVFLQLANKLGIFGLTLTDEIEAENNNKEHEPLEIQIKNDRQTTVEEIFENKNKSNENLHNPKTSIDILPASKVSDDIQSPQQSSSANNILSAPTKSSDNILLHQNLQIISFLHKNLCIISFLLKELQMTPFLLQNLQITSFWQQSLQMASFVPQHLQMTSLLPQSMSFLQLMAKKQ